MVVYDVSASLDGFTAGPNDDVEPLHEWLYGLSSWRESHGKAGGTGGADSDVLAEALERTGATLMGRRLFDLGEGPWGDEPPFHVPVFVLTHEQREPLAKRGGTTFTFVTDGIESALEQARAAAGDGDVSVAGGASIAQQYLRAGLLDEIQIHLVPVLLGGGVRLFDDPGGEPIGLETTRVIESTGVTHLRFSVAR